jgi:hypothetical protein
MGKAYVQLSGFVSVVWSIKLISIIINGWVLAMMWGWFVVPTFNLSQISIPEAIGISLIIYFLIMHSDVRFKFKDKTEDKSGCWLARLLDITFHLIGPSLRILILGGV